MQDIDMAPNYAPEPPTEPVDASVSAPPALNVPVVDPVTVSEYTAQQITVLEGLSAVRVRPSMYVGNVSTDGLHHLVYEVVDNSIDEALAGYCDHIRVQIHLDGSITVDDNGRGIPVDIHEKENIPAVTVVMTMLHAGGKGGGSRSSKSAK